MTHQSQMLDIIRIGEGICDLKHVDWDSDEKLKHVQTVTFHCNRLQNTMGLPKFQSLTELDLSSNFITTMDLPELAHLHSLQILDLSANKIVSLENAPFVPGLRILRLAFNSIGTLHSIEESMPELEELDIRGNNLECYGSLKAMGLLKCLKQVSIGGSAGNLVCARASNMCKLFNDVVTLETVDGISSTDWQVLEDKEAEMLILQQQTAESQQMVETPKFDMLSNRYRNRGAGGVSPTRSNPWADAAHVIFTRPFPPTAAERVCTDPMIDRIFSNDLFRGDDPPIAHSGFTDSLPQQKDELPQESPQNIAKVEDSTSDQKMKTFAQSLALVLSSSVARELARVALRSGFGALLRLSHRRNGALIETLRAQINSLRKATEEEDAVARSARAQRDSELAEAQAALTTQSRLLEEVRNRAREAAIAAQSEMAELAKRVEREEQRVQICTRRVAEHEAAAAKLTRALEKSEESRGAQEAQLTTASRELSALRGRVQDLEDAHNMQQRAQEQLTAEHVATVQAVRHELAGALLAKDELESELANWRNESNLERERILVAQRAAEAETAMLGIKLDAAQNSAAAAKSQLEEFIANQCETMTILSMERAKISGLQSDLATEVAKGEKLQRRLVSTQDAFEAAATEIERLNQALADTEEKKEQLKGAIEELKALVVRQQQSSKRLAAKYQELRHAHEELIKENGDLKSSYSKSRQEGVAVVGAESGAVGAAVCPTCDALTQDLRAVSRALQDAQRAQGEQQQHVLRLTADLGSSSESAANAVREVADLRMERDGLLEKVVSLQREVVQNADAAREARGLAAAQEAKLQDLSLALKIKEAMIDDQASLVLDIRAKLGAYEKENVALKRELDDVDAKLEECRAEIGDFEDQLSAKSEVEKELRALLNEIRFTGERDAVEQPDERFERMDQDTHAGIAGPLADRQTSGLSKEVTGSAKEVTWVGSLSSSTAANAAEHKEAAIGLSGPWATRRGECRRPECAAAVQRWCEEAAALRGSLEATKEAAQRTQIELLEAKTALMERERAVVAANAAWDEEKTRGREQAETHRTERKRLSKICKQQQTDMEAKEAELRRAKATAEQLRRAVAAMEC